MRGTECNKYIQLYIYSIYILYNSEVGRVPKICTQVKVKVLLENIYSSTSKSNSLNSYLSKSKKSIR